MPPLTRRARLAAVASALTPGVARVIAIAVAIVVAGSALAPASARADKPHNSQLAVRAGLVRDTESDRTAGVDGMLFGEFRGFGIALTVDYHRLRQILPLTPQRDQEVYHHSANFGFGLRFSPLGLIGGGYRLQRILDVYGYAGVSGGITGAPGGVAFRSSTRLGLGVDLRFGYHPGWLSFPGLSFEFITYGERSPDYATGKALIIGLTWVSTDAVTPRD